MPDNNNQPKMPRFNMNWIYGLILISLMILFWTGGGDAIARSASKEADYTTFKTYVEKGYAKKVVINKTESVLRMYVDSKNYRDVFNKTAEQLGKEPYVSVQFGDVGELERYLTTMQKAKKMSSFSYENKRANDFFGTLVNFAPFLIFLFLMFYLFRGWGSGAGPRRPSRSP